jgi:hypothetical protein
MGRCNNCQFENVADAKACARCGQRLVTGGGGVADADAASTLPDWMRSVQTDVGRQREAGPVLAQSGGVAAAATLPVQVRRSRVPVLSVSGPAAAAAGDVPSSVTSPASVASATGGDVPATPRRSSRLRMILLVAVIIAIAILAYLAVHGGA